MVINEVKRPGRLIHYPQRSEVARARVYKDARVPANKAFREKNENFRIFVA